YCRFPRKDIIRIDPQPGDLIVGFSSSGQSVYEKEYNSGIGCNGLTSARHDMLNKYYAEHFPETFDPQMDASVCYTGKHRVTDAVFNNINAGKLLLSPTRTYAPVLNEILKRGLNGVHGIVHNTGGGQTKCLKYIGEKVRLVKDNLFDVPPIFQMIQEQSGASRREMYQVLNMGHRQEVYTTTERVEELVGIGTALGIDTQLVGRVETAEKKQVILKGNFGEIIY
ncbi:MAG: phosphoribosylformylglycinamidine cyclo-ligase, partial [Dinghuibacter sp.]|nr:phosphoribosylformylglycinamidine cyclo-ligase [Dinghuibacter sp.]